MNKLLILFPALLLLSACGPNPGAEIDVARTAAAQTLDAQLSLAQAQETARAAQASQTALAQELNTLETQNAKLEMELNQTQSAQSTFAAIEPQLLAPAGAICRLGPAAGFARAATLEAGTSIRIIGRSTDGDWWQAQLPDESICWIFWSNDLGFEGDVFNLPLVQGPSLPTNTPAPTRPPGFALSYVTDHTCEGVATGIFEIRNTGPETYESLRITLSDPATGTAIRTSDSNNEFLPSSTSCPKGASALGPGQSAFLAISVAGTKDGDLLRVNVRLCTENGLGGSCISGNRDFTR